MNASIEQKSRNAVETVLIMLLLLLLLYSLYSVLKVFFGIFTYALIFAVSFSGAFESLSKLLGGRRKLAALIYCIVLIGLIAQPFLYVIHAIHHHLNAAEDWITDTRTHGIPPLSPALTGLPLVGEEISEFWEKLQQNPKETIGLYDVQIRMVLQKIISGGAGMIGAGVEFIAGVIISAFFLVKGSMMLKPVEAFLKHMVGEHDGPALLEAGARAVRGVSIGVMGTALIAAVFSFIGFVVAPIPIPLIFAALIFFLVVIQIGPLPVLVPLIIWLFIDGKNGWGVFLIGYTVVLMAIDSVLKPLLIARSGKLPFLVLFLGVIGGMGAWGFTGMFKGAIILAVFYTIFTSWLERKNKPVPATNYDND